MHKRHSEGDWQNLYEEIYNRGQVKEKRLSGFLRASTTRDSEEAKEEKTIDTQGEDRNNVQGPSQEGDV